MDRDFFTRSFQLPFSFSMSGLGPGAAVFCFLIALVLTFLVTIASRCHSGDSLNSSKILKVAPLVLLRICPSAWTKFRYLEVVAS